MEGPYGGRDGGRVDIETGAWSDLALGLPATACSLELLVGYDGRRGNGGLDNSLYVIAGMVPSPIHPFSGVLLPDGDEDDALVVAPKPAENE